MMSRFQLLLRFVSGLALVFAALMGQAQAQSLPVVVGHRLVTSSFTNEQAYLTFWGAFDRRDSDGVYRPEGKAFSWIRYPGQDWLSLDSIAGSWSAGSRSKTIPIHPAGFELKVCEVDNVCSLPYLVKTAPLYMGDAVIRKNPGSSDRSVTIWFSNNFGGPVQMTVYQRHGTYPNFSAQVWPLESITCGEGFCRGLLPVEVMARPSTYKVTLHTRTGQIDEREQPDLVIPAPLKIFRSGPSPIDTIDIRP